jgi:hypothetical protein
MHGKMNGLNYYKSFARRKKERKKGGKKKSDIVCE